MADAASTLKDYWPLLAAGGLVAIGVALYGQGGTTSSGYQTVQPDNTAAYQLANSQMQAETAQLQAIGSAANSYENYLSTSQYLDNQAAQNTENMMAEEYAYMTQESIANNQMLTAQNIASTQASSSWWSNFLGMITKVFGGDPAAAYQAIGA